MISVTQRIAQIKQPRGGYLPVAKFEVTQFKDNRYMRDIDSRKWAARVGLVVDYISRWLYCGVSKEKAFEISLLGAQEAQKHYPNIPFMENAMVYLSKITQPLTDYDSIVAALRLVGYDVFYRVPEIFDKPFESKEADAIPEDVVRNIHVMLLRSGEFFQYLVKQQNGVPLIPEYTFEGGYTDTVGAGDGDFASVDTLWDMKCIKGEITPKYTLQILMYYIMGLHSVHDFYKGIKYLGFYNPLLNKMYKVSVSEIDANTRAIVEKDIIGY